MRRALICCAALLATALALTACESKTDPALSPSVTPAASIPVTLTLTSPAEGARVAAYRFGLSGAKVDLVTAQDDGTTTGLQTAIDSLASQSVAGIVVAAAGPHVDQTLAGLHVTVPLLPYDTPVTRIPGVWATGPSRTAVAAATVQAMKDAGVSRPFLLVQQGWTIPSGITATATAQVGSGDPLPTQVLTDLDSGAVDAVLIAASADVQASLVAAIQQGLGTRQAPCS